MGVRVRLGCVLAAVVVVGCNFEMPPANHINATELIMVKHSVELGPLYPGRVGPTFVGIENAPIAEVLPGDRLRLEAVVVDIDGRRLDDDQLDSLWVLCGWSCLQEDLDFAWPWFEERCDEVDEFTTSSDCVLGTGSGSFDFEVPPLGRHAFYRLPKGSPRTTAYGVVAWGNRTATECWVSRRNGNSEIEDCGFIFHHVPIGPTWLAVAHAAANGVEFSSLEVPVIPEWLGWLPANRVPLTPTIRIRSAQEVVAEGVPPLAPIRLEPGATFAIHFDFDPLSQALQTEPFPLSESGNFWTLHHEHLASRTATSGAIRSVISAPPRPEDEVVYGDDQFTYEIDPEAPPGTSRVLIIYTDSRGAGDFLTVEFEVE